MFNKVIEAIEPFALTLIVFAGMSLAGWVHFTNSYVVGVATFAAGVLLIVAHVAKKLSTETKEK